MPRGVTISGHGAARTRLVETEPSRLEIAGLGDDLEALLAVEEHAESAAHDAVVIGDHDLGHRP
jgi:hypothetical protein